MAEKALPKLFCQPLKVALFWGVLVFSTTSSYSTVLYLQAARYHLGYAR